MKTALVDFRTPYDALVEKEQVGVIDDIPVSDLQAYIVDGSFGISSEVVSDRDMAHKFCLSHADVSHHRMSALRKIRKHLESEGINPSGAVIAEFLSGCANNVVVGRRKYRLADRMRVGDLVIPKKFKVPYYRCKAFKINDNDVRRIALIAKQLHNYVSSGDGGLESLDGSKMIRVVRLSTWMGANDGPVFALFYRKRGRRMPR